MTAIERFTEWVRGRTHVDRAGRLPPEARISLHSRSDAHSVKLTELILDDLLDTCADLREQAARGDVAYGINYAFQWPNGKIKTLDLAIGIPLVQQDPPPNGGRIRRFRSRAIRGRPTAPPEQQFARLLIACEAKSVLTEHGKSQPRVFDELNGSHAIVHGGSQDTIAVGITLINISPTFVSPLRWRPDRPLVMSIHHQPADATSMVRHLRGLPRRSLTDPVGFDAYCSFVMDVDNQGRVALWSDPPAPQPGDSDHYGRFVADICGLYARRYHDLDRLPEPRGLVAAEALQALARRYPGLLDDTGQLAGDAELAGAPALHAMLKAIEIQAHLEHPSPEEGVRIAAGSVAASPARRVDRVAPPR